MRGLIRRVLRREEVDGSGHPLSRRHKIALGLLLLIALAGQLWRVGDRYVLAYETGFQELIARRHLDPGLRVTQGLSTVGNLGPKPTYHPTHPPLLQILLALVFRLCGDSEASARLVPIGSFFLTLLGLWHLTRNRLSPDGCLAVLAAAVFAPLSFYMGRVVNFEPPVVACVVWTMVLIDKLEVRPSWQTWIALYLVAAVGTLIDWPYLLFTTSLGLLCFLRGARGSLYRQAALRIWAVSIALSVIYVAIVYSRGAMGDVLHHAGVRMGAYSAQEGLRVPPILASLSWWWSLLRRTASYGTPILLVCFLIGLVWVFCARRYRETLHHWCMVLAVFCIGYLGLFSQASSQHFWCLFYLSPLLCLTFGLVMDRLNAPFRYLLLGILIACSLPQSHRLRSEAPLLQSTLLGRAIRSATEFLPEEKRKPMAGPLLYVDRVDPLPYYARCETAFVYISVKADPADVFLMRHRPEFVALTEYASVTSFRTLPQPPSDLFRQLATFYTLVNDDFTTKLWESLWSPNLSLMALMRTADGKVPQKFLAENQDDLYLAARASPGKPALRFDLRAVPKPGRRWVHGWVMDSEARSTTPIAATVQADNERELATIHVAPGTIRPRWQEFWLYVGNLPDWISFSWESQDLLWGDIRLVSETLWTEDLTQVLAGEIRRILGPKAYTEIVKVEEYGHVADAVLQHPGFGVDSVDLPPLRAGYGETLVVTYGLHPRTALTSDGVDFRLYIRDYAQGERELLFEDSLRPAERPQDRGWRTRRINMHKHSRHLFVLTFEVTPGPSGNADYDHALWRDIRFVPNR